MPSIDARQRNRFKRLRVVVDASLMTSTASLATINIFNRDSNAHITGGTIAQIPGILRSLGYDVNHGTDVVYTAPAQ